jgi:hypothetical protein
MSKLLPTAGRQISNEIQSLNVKFLILGFDIDLTLACLREAAPAKAGILTFGIISV